MERIVIEVTDNTAKKWRLSSQQLRDEISQRIDVRLAKELMNDPKKDFKQFLDEMSETLKERGLTEEELRSILESDE